ncbi:MAG: metallophosphoesterase [Oscillospiraceae bacterium]|nr:metallophosphoesterase [Oscillospiraceae bacterium]
MQETCYEMNTPVSLALVSDLHEKPSGPVLSSLRFHRPNIICIVGDLVYGCLPKKRGQIKIEDAGVLPFLSACADMAPTFFSLGNHEWMLSDADFARIGETGVQVLDNRWVNCGDLAIGGLSSARPTRYQQFRAALHSDELYPYQGDRYIHAEPEIAWLSEFEKFPGYKILLSHHPEYYPRYLADRDIDLVLSGHAHGGQIRLFGQGLYAPGQGVFPRYTAGVHNGRLVISRGLANNTLVPRLFNPPELVYISPHI